MAKEKDKELKQLGILTRMLSKKFKKPEAICSAMCFGCINGNIYDPSTIGSDNPVFVTSCTDLSCEKLWENLLTYPSRLERYLTFGIRTAELVDNYER